MRNYSINIVNKKRAFLTLLTVTLLILIILNLSFPINTVSGTQQPEFISYLVKDGDTVWSIAEKHNDSNKDIRETVFEINKVNHIEKNAYLIAGETIKIPIN